MRSTWFAILLAIGGCSSAPASMPLAEAAPQAHEIRTTSGAIFSRNLDSRIAGIEARLATNPRRADQLALAASLHTRGSARGAIDDIARSIELATLAIDVYPEDSNALLLRARSELSVHRFDDARRDLALATEHGASRAATLPLETELDWNAGNYDRAMLRIRNLAEIQPGMRTLARVALLEHALGSFEAADARFGEAERHLDTDPLGAAWFYVQWGKSLMDRGELERAERMLREAVARLPDYVLAREHLAECLGELGRTAESIAIYEDVIRDSADPEFKGALAAQYRAIGRTAEADAMRDQATAGFRAALERHPAAMYWHAASYFLGEGDDPALALSLLTANVALRPNSESLVALANAQLANGQDARTTIDRALAMPMRSRDLLETAARAYAASGDLATSRVLEHQASKVGEPAKR